MYNYCDKENILSEIRCWYFGEQSPEGTTLINILNADIGIIWSNLYGDFEM